MGRVDGQSLLPSGHPDRLDRRPTAMGRPSGCRGCASQRAKGHRGSDVGGFRLRPVAGLGAAPVRREQRDGRTGPEPVGPKPAAAPSELQRLIDAAQPGATVAVPKGTHTVPVRITNPLTLKGSSAADCILEVTADGPALSIDAGGQGYVFIEGLTIKWQLAGGAKGVEPPVALVVKDTQAAIRNCRFLPLGNTQRAPMAIRIEGRSWARVSRLPVRGIRLRRQLRPGHRRSRRGLPPPGRRAPGRDRL